MLGEQVPGLGTKQTEIPSLQYTHEENPPSQMVLWPQMSTDSILGPALQSNT